MNIEFSLIDPAEMNVILPLLMELDPSIEKEVLEIRLSQMLVQGYECVGVYDEGNLIGICGIWMLVKYYVGKHIEPDDVFIKPAYRGKGIGEQLQLWLEQLAISRDCEALELNCYIANEAGCRFWEFVGYHKLGIHYRKKLK